MIKKLYQKCGIVYLDTSYDHRVKDIDKNYFIVKELSKNNDIKKDEIIKKYYESKGFTYTL